MADPSKPPPDLPPDETDEELVAYLDGELDRDEARAVEAKLTHDETARQKADTLKKTFDLLDYLPKPEPSPTFATRTLTQINPVLGSGAAIPVPTPSASNGTLPPTHTTGLTPTLPPPMRTGWKVLLWSLGLAAVTATGYFGHLLAKPHLEATDPAKRTSEQVRLLERLPLYLGVDDFEFLTQLDQLALFPDEDGESAEKPGVDTLSTAELEQLENVFKQYPAARQQQLRRLDEQLSAQDPPRQAHLIGVLERYAIWLDRLPDNYRKEILTAPAAVERLEGVKTVKARLWREGLPAVVRERIQQADPAARDQLVADRRQQDAKRKQLWELARHDWSNISANRRPWPFDIDELTKKVEEYVERTLKPRLNNAERAELDLLRKDVTAAPGRLAWLMYGDTLARLAELHRTLPEPANGKTIRAVGDLPQQFVRDLAKKAGTNRKQLIALPGYGRWPDFAEAVLVEAHEVKVPIPFPLGPNKLDEYAPAVRAFVETELNEKLTSKERDELRRAESGQWPDHSKKLMDFARKYDLSVPGVTLPGPPSKWDQVYRNRPGKK
jgi:hypothetical protein